MASDLLTKWLVHYDPIHRGYAPNGIANGVTATGGWTFPRVGGGYNLYRGVGSSEAVDFDHPVGAAGGGASSVMNFSWRPHAASTRYCYRVKSIGGGGVESAASVPAAVAEFDALGALVGLRPNGPTGFLVRPVAGGKFGLRWVYVSRFEEAAPDHFAVFHDGGTGSVDYATVVATVPHRSGRAHYGYTSAAFAHDARRVWGVRAVTAGGVDDGNVTVAFAWADAAAPEVHPLVRLARVVPEED